MLLNFLTALLVIVTAVYAWLTYRLSKSAADSVLLAQSHFLLSKQPIVLVMSEAGASYADRQDPDWETLQSLKPNVRIRGEFPAFDVRLALQMIEPAAHVHLHEQVSSFHQGETYLPEDRHWGCWFIFDTPIPTRSLPSPLRAELSLSYTDLFGTRWTSRWRLELLRGEQDARVDLVDLTNSYLPRREPAATGQSRVGRWAPRRQGDVYDA